MIPRYKMKILTDFAAAHYLRDYEGVCSRLHGHNWKVEVQVVASELNHVGMGLDFKDIKDATKKLIAGMDHYNLNDVEPFDKINPTAENIAAFFFKELSKELNSQQVKVDSISIWETDRACVTYTEEIE
jgi:6-pyruvoyltetrahydropterin/6-carboxytetrahydropterin synthase